MFVDSHCHLDFPEFAGRIDAIRADMAAAGVDRALCISTALDGFEAVHAQALAQDNFWCSVGVHPDNDVDREPTLAELVERAARPKVVAIGETGLDYYRLGQRTVADMEWQRDRFRTHIAASRATGKPLVVHTRSSSDDTIAILKEAGEGAVGGVFHCFTETEAVARAALDLGFFISFSGILTFKTAEALRSVAAFVPLDRCLIETDSPFLAPVPFRGKTNTPALVPHVAAQLAEVKKVSVQAIAKATSGNFERLFTIPRIRDFT